MNEPDTAPQPGRTRPPAPPDNRPSVAFKTLGCRLNQAETAAMQAPFLAAGYRIVPFGHPADVCVIHGCTVTRKAELNSLRFCRAAKAANSRTTVVLAGCTVEGATPTRLADSRADLFAGQATKHDIPALLRHHNTQSPPPPPSPAANYEPIPDPDDSVHPRTRAIVKAQDGCSFHCAYCIVPTVRGPPTSRPVHEILAEIQTHTARGCREIVIGGCNLACYDHNGARLPDLLAQAVQIPHLHRIRLSSIELSTVERRIVDFMADNPSICRYLHIPLQSGDDSVLHAMKRRYTAAQYRAFIEYALNRIPLLGLGADVIVGFPGETRAAFQNTLALLRDIPFSNLHIFPFSSRPGTPAASLPAPLARPEIRARAEQALELAATQQQAFAERLLGNEVQVLIEELRPDGTACGWTGQYVRLCLKHSTARIHDIITCTPTTRKNTVLYATA